VVDLEKDFGTIYRTVGQVGYKSSGLIYQALKDSSKIMEIQVQILPCTDLGQQFDPNALALYGSIPITRLASHLPQLCAACRSALQPAGWALRYRGAHFSSISVRI